MRFEFATAGRIVFGPGTLQEIGAIAAPMGRRAFVVMSGSAERVQPLLDALDAAGIAATTLGVTHEPTTDLAQQGVQEARAFGADLVIGMGGGSVLDTGKAIAALLTNPGPVLDFLEVIGRGQKLSAPSAPYIAIPTTAGTGTEVTRNAVLASPEHRVKVSLRSAFMLPDVALVDPELTYSLPPEVTAYTGLDALTQLIEPFVSIKRNALVDGFCRAGLPRAARSLRRAYESGDPAAREDMSFAALCGGLALANAGLGAAHGFAGPMGGMFPTAPHGAVCAALLPHVMRANVDALREREPGSEVLDRYDEVARIVTGDPAATADDGVRWVQDLSAALNVPPLRAYGVTPADFPALVEKGSVASSMKGNPLTLTASELDAILKAAH